MNFAIHPINLDIAICRNEAIESIRGRYALSADLVDDTDVDMQVMQARTEEILTLLRAHAE